jgi:hypothetical protein
MICTFALVNMPFKIWALLRVGCVFSNKIHAQDNAFSKKRL